MDGLDIHHSSPSSSLFDRGALDDLVAPHRGAPDAHLARRAGRVAGGAAVAHGGHCGGARGRAGAASGAAGGGRMLKETISIKWEVLEHLE